MSRFVLLHYVDRVLLRRPCGSCDQMGAILYVLGWISKLAADVHYPDKEENRMSALVEQIVKNGKRLRDFTVLYIFKAHYSRQGQCSMCISSVR